MNSKRGWRCCGVASKSSGGVFDLAGLKLRHEECETEMATPEFWEDRQRAERVSRNKSELEAEIGLYGRIETALEDAGVLLELAAEADDDEVREEASGKFVEISEALEQAELHQLLGGEHDAANAILSINSGAGGTDACDWAEMLMRMYLRWAERRGFQSGILDVQSGEEAGIRSATLSIKGNYAYGHLNAEQGVHRLVRISPFDSQARRHTAFASVTAVPEIDDEVELEIDEGDLRIDTYRSSGAGGQHVNKTDSAVRLTHLPTGEVVQCQNQRSQHQNKDQAIKQLKARLYELEEMKQRAELEEIEDNKSDISWGSQIRSYVLDSARIKDLRTNLETGNTQAVLDGDLDQFMEASLKQGL